MLYRAAQAETPSRPVRLGAPARLETVLCLLGFVALWCLGRSYNGIVGDAILYIGRGIADADKAGVGSDLMFVDDGQSQFSLFTLAVRALVERFGPGQASLLLTIGGQLLWLTAITGLVLQTTAGRPRAALATLIAVAVLPSFYGPYQRFHFAEVLAVPRPYAEALVLIALTAVLRRRDALGIGALAVASLLHPIMALAGFGTLLAIKAQEDRRWLIAMLAAAVALLSAGWLGAPLADRLFMPLDAQWRTILLGRSPMLFPTHWNGGDFAALAVQVVTLCISASLARGRLRALLLGALVTGLGGLVISEVLGDQLSLLLVVQAQPWRALWLIALLSVLGFVHCGLVLCQRNDISKLAFMFLVLGWCFIDQPIIAATSMVAAGAAYSAGLRTTFQLGASNLGTAAFAVGALVLIEDMKKIAAYLKIMGSMPSAVGHDFIQVWTLGLLSVPLTLLAIVWACNATYRWRPTTTLGLTLLLSVAATQVWDHRAPMQKQIETEGPPADLVRITSARAGSVLWIEGIEETTLWLQRPNWYSTLQGTGAVFSRQLALEWARRRSVLIGLKLLPDADAGLPSEVTTRPLPRVSADQIERLCRLAGTLGWIVIPALAGAETPQVVDAINWTPTKPVFRVSATGETPRWLRIDHYVLAPCAVDPPRAAGQTSSFR